MGVLKSLTGMHKPVVEPSPQVEEKEFIKPKEDLVDLFAAGKAKDGDSEGPLVVIKTGLFLKSNPKPIATISSLKKVTVNEGEGILFTKYSSKLKHLIGEA